MLVLNPWRKPADQKKNEKGIALVESLPVLFILVILFNFSLGFFGAIHSGILNSIGAYNYTLETFRYRSDLIYFRPGGGLETHYKYSQNRVHGVIQDGNESNDTKLAPWPVTVRTVAFSMEATKINVNDNNTTDHQFKQKDTETNVWKHDSNYAPSSNSTTNIPEIWIKTVYGICLNADCK